MSSEIVFSKWKYLRNFESFHGIDNIYFYPSVSIVSGYTENLF